MIMWMFLILLVARIVGSYLVPSVAWVLAFDVLTLFMVWPMVDRLQYSKAIEAWRYLQFRFHQRKRLQLISAILLDALRVLSLIFLFLWLARWWQTSHWQYNQWYSRQDLAQLDAFLLCFFMSHTLSAQRLSLILSKVPLTQGRKVLIHYLIAILLGALLLLMPFSVQGDQSLSLIDSLFIAVSALSVTGLSPVDISVVLTVPGQAILLILIQLGGLGVIMVTAALSLALQSRLSLGSMLLGQTAFGISSAGDMPKFLSRVVGVTFLFEIIGALVIYFNLSSTTPNRLFVAVFHSISAFCNAGFSTFSNNLHQSPFGVIGITTICILIILGGLGFPVLFDLGRALNQYQFKFNRLSVNSRLSLFMTVFLLLLGFLLFVLFETVAPTAAISLWERIGYAIFYSVSSRTAGFNMLPLENFHLSAQFFLVLLMFIGANPTSTGGGVKTNTIGVLLLTVYHSVLGRAQSVFLGRSISFEIVKRALSIVVIYLLVAGAGITLLILFEQQDPFALAFEVFSALSTVGLSLQITPKLTFIGKFIIMLMMLFGRIGILSFVLAGLGDQKKSQVQYPEDEFLIG